MKKNKTVAYMLAATLLVGGTFLGTKALFTDKVDSIGELTISTGDLDIRADATKDWTLDRNGEEDLTGTDINEKVFDNLKTGDKLEKSIRITNDGTLKANISINRSILDEKLPEGIIFTGSIDNKTINDQTYTKTLEKGEHIDLDLKIHVTGGGKHIKNESLTGNETANQLNSDAQNEEVIDLKDSYVIEAVQENPDNLTNNNQ